MPKNSMMKKLRETRETSGLEVEQEEVEPAIGKNFQTNFQRPNEYSENILLTDSNFILSNKAYMSFKTRLDAYLKREYQNVEFLFRKRPGVGGLAAFPPSVSQVPGKFLCFLVTKVSEKNVVDPEQVVLSLTRLRDFVVERIIEEISTPVYDTSRGKLNLRELYVIFSVFTKTR